MTPAMLELFAFALLLASLLLALHLPLRARAVDLQRAARTAPELGLRPTFATLASRASLGLLATALLPFAAAATAMRRILVEHARRRKAFVRGGGVHRVTLSTELLPVEIDLVGMLALDEALDRLQAEHARSAQAVHLHYFAGQSSGEIADLLGVSALTVRRDLGFAMRFLGDQLGAGGSTEGGQMRES